MTKDPHWNYVNSLVSWLIVTAGFYYTQWRHTTAIQTAAVFVGCFVIVLFANVRIDAMRNRRNRPH